MLTLFVYGQEASVSGIVIDSLTSLPLYPTNIIVKDKATTNYLYGTITSDKGKFEFNGLRQGEYIFTISFVGYQTKKLVVNILENEKLDFGKIQLSILPIHLSEIEIVFKPLFNYDDDGNITLNIDMMGNVEKMSVADAIQSVPGMYYDFDGGLHYNDFTFYETLINGKVLGSNFNVTNPAGNSMQFKLKQIPAKFIKIVEILPEPNGKYGMFNPVINLIANGDLRDFYDASSELGVKKKYGINGGISKLYDKLTLTTGLGYRIGHLIPVTMNSVIVLIVKIYRILKLVHPPIC